MSRNSHIEDDRRLSFQIAIMSIRHIFNTSVHPLRRSLVHPLTLASRGALARAYGTEFTDLLANAKKEAHPGIDDCDICRTYYPRNLC